MSSQAWQFLSGLAAIVALTGCGGGGSVNPDAHVTLRAQFEKRTLSSTGWGTTLLKPARYCWAEVRDSSSNTLIASGYLGSEGTGTTTIPKGHSVYMTVYAQYEVPSADPNSFFMRGSIKNAPLPFNYVAPTTFSAFPEWSVTSSDFIADHDGTLTATALVSDRSGGAFNIADQAVTFAAAVRDLDGSTSLRLPDLHTFWTTSNTPADQTRTYPALTYSSATEYLVSDKGRALFSHGVYGSGSGAAGTETDEWDDGVLQETFARLLFADASYKADGSSTLSLLRRDNDNVRVDRDVQSESTAAFVAGFSDFLSCAVRNNSQILDSYVDSNGIARVAAFDLTDHTYVSAANKGEFARGSIAVSLWGLWKNVLGGGQTGLSTLWAATRSTTPYLDGTGEYEQATLGCYPTYLQGVASRVSATTWTAALNELALEAIPNPDAIYFSGTALWNTRPVGFSESDSLQTYNAIDYYDRNQSRAWRFNHAGGARTITVTPTSGQDFYLELIGPGGLVAANIDQSFRGKTRVINLSSLPAGVYVARVRATQYDTVTGLNSYTISVN